MRYERDINDMQYGVKKIVTCFSLIQHVTRGRINDRNMQHWPLEKKRFYMRHGEFIPNYAAMIIRVTFISVCFKNISLRYVP